MSEWPLAVHCYKDVTEKCPRHLNLRCHKDSIDRKVFMDVSSHLGEVSDHHRVLVSVPVLIDAYTLIRHVTILQ